MKGSFDDKQTYRPAGAGFLKIKENRNTGMKPRTLAGNFFVTAAILDDHLQQSTRISRSWRITFQRILQDQ